MDSTLQQSPSMSRYKSKRHPKEVAKSPPPQSSLPQPELPEDVPGQESQNLQRSRSRYRATRPGTAPSTKQKSASISRPDNQASVPLVPPMPPVNTFHSTVQQGAELPTTPLQVSRSNQTLRPKPERYIRSNVTGPHKSRSAQDLRNPQAPRQEPESKQQHVRKVEAERQRQIALQSLSHNERPQKSQLVKDQTNVPLTMPMALTTTVLPPQMMSATMPTSLQGEDMDIIRAEQRRRDLERAEEEERLRWHKKRELQRMNTKRMELIKMQKESDAKQRKRRDVLQNRQRSEQAEHLRRQQFREMQRDAAEQSDILHTQANARKAGEQQVEKIQQGESDNEVVEFTEKREGIRSKLKEDKVSPQQPFAEQQLPKVPENHQLLHQTAQIEASAHAHSEDRSQASRSRQDSATTAPRPSTSRDMFGFLKKKRSNEANLGRSRTMSAPKKSVDIRPGGGGVVPGIDAPVSAVNAGERWVTIECGRSRRVFPVTPITTPVDLIRSSSIVMSEQIDPKSSVLFEDFSKVGVRRPLRKYEHVRDVMNSWDDDSQNSLVLLPSTTGGNDANLEAACVTEEQPNQVSLCLFYSNKPGKWEKRWVVMRQDGQVQHAKKVDSPSKDFTNICHLSDFDIYTPDPKSLSKKIRPPKKHCLAIKSQQKSNMFLTMDNFVHFFATADKVEAGKWHDAIQGWRSWYLVNVLGEGKQSTRQDGSLQPNSQAWSHQRNASNQSAYQLGSFQPLLDLDMFKEPTTDLQSTLQLATHGGLSRSTSTNHRHQRSRSGGPPSSFRKNLIQDGAQGSHTRGISNAQSTQSATSGGGEGDGNGTFAPSGLLGRSYSVRQKAQREREATVKNEDGFVGGSNLLSDLHILPSRTSTDHAPESTLTRTQSKRGPKPLIDITTATQEGPQHSQKGKGFIPDSIGAGGLVQSATSPEVVINIPSVTDWRSRPQDQEGRKSLDRSKSQHKRHMNSGSGSEEPLFLQDGLLANSRTGVGEGRPGRGVMDGSKATGPMLDVNQRSKFAMGSLLAKLHKDNGPDAPIIDRTKEGEIIQTKTGEGL